MKIFSYVVEHDNGRAPNPYFEFCTLCRCKYREDGAKPRNIVELAREGDWVIGTGGSSERSAGHGKLVYAMRVDERIPRGEYFGGSRFAKKKPDRTGTYEDSRGDNERPKNRFERKEQFVLISEHFYYFGRNAVPIPKEFKRFEKKGPGFRYCGPDEFSSFIHWLETEYRMGKLGEPCYEEPSSRRERCRLCS